MTTLAIVGSVLITPSDPRSSFAAALIVEAIDRFAPALIISGGARGIDTLGVDIARTFGIPYQEFLPKNARWAPEGYQERNLLIAQSCSHLLRISAVESRTYGSGWTADQAERLGRKVARVSL